MHAQRNAPGKCYKICHIFGMNKTLCDTLSFSWLNSPFFHGLENSLREKKILVVVTLDKISKGKNYAGFSYTSEVLL